MRHGPGPALCLLLVLATVVARAEGPTSDDLFCGRVQQTFAGTTLEPRNTVYADYQAFRESKTVVRPLQTHQFVLRDAGGVPLRVSCKVKTPDHLNAEYGPGTAQDRGVTCRDINRETARRVYAELGATDAKRVQVPLARVVFEDDETTFMGSGWVGPYEFAWGGTDGRLHILAKALRVDWDNVWLSWAPDRLRGAYYCHLVAPEYLHRLALGEMTAPPAR
jgi:hypothetical protein